MLTVFRWREFWLRFVQGAGLQAFLLVLTSCVFASGFVYMGQSSDALVLSVVKTHPWIVVGVLLRVLGACAVVALLAQAMMQALGWTTRAALGACFFLACTLRMAMCYPAMTENWIIVRGLPSVAAAIARLAALGEGSLARAAVSWAPFAIAAGAFVASAFKQSRFLRAQNERFDAVKRGILVEELERESRRFSIGGVSLVLSVVGAVLSLPNLSPIFPADMPREDSGQYRPHVFVFAIDSLRTDRLLAPGHADVMPFLRSRIGDASLASPMLVGVPRTFPSWVEMATCMYAPRNGIRTMFPGRAHRMARPSPEGAPALPGPHAPDTLFAAARRSGYRTLFVSDFAGDVFPRYPFGADRVIAPTANLETLIETSTLQSVTSLQAVLAFPSLHRALKPLLATAEFADPRLLARTFAQALDQNAPSGRPVMVTTFFSTAHFPYAAPSPYHALFQKPGPDGKLAYKKDSDQVVSGPKGAPESPRSTQAARQEESAAEARARKALGLYDGSLRAIDVALESLWKGLEEQGWLENAIVVVLGDHGENLYEGKLGNGHGDGVGGEYATQTPLLVWTFGRAEESRDAVPERPIVRSVDVAPTLARRAGVPFDAAQCDGAPLLDVNDKQVKFPLSAAYQESEIWFTPDPITPENHRRVVYPGVLGLLDLDPGMNFEFVVRPNYTAPITSVKERAWVTDKYRLVARTTTLGTSFSLYDRPADPASANDLLAHPASAEDGRVVAAELIRQLNEYLASQGVEIVRNAEGRFFYAENVSR